MIALDFQHGTALDLDEALEAVSGGAVPYAGATELIPGMRMGLIRADRIVDLKAVPELNGIRVSGSSIEIGAATTHAAITRALGPTSDLPAAARAFSAIGNPRVRAQGTIGGNVVFAEPRSDVLTFLSALEVTCRFASLAGARQVPLREALVGPFTLDKKRDEILVSLEIDTAGIEYQDYGRIQVGERPVVAMTLVRIGHVWRLVVGAATYTPVMFESDEVATFGEERRFDGLELMEDLAGSAEYKRHLVGVMAGRMIEAARRGTEGR